MVNGIVRDKKYRLFLMSHFTQRSLNIIQVFTRNEALTHSHQGSLINTYEPVSAIFNIEFIVAEKFSEFFAAGCRPF